MSAEQASEDDIAHFRSVIAAHKKRLRILEVRAAKSGIETPPQIQIEIDDINRQIATLEQQTNKGTVISLVESKALLAHSSRSLKSVEQKLQNTARRRWRDYRIYLILVAFAFIIGFVVGRFSALEIGVPDSPSTSGISVERIPATVFSLGGENDPDVKGGSAQLEVISNKNNDRMYKLHYDLPEEGRGYADMAFEFTEPQDFTDFKKIRVTMSFRESPESCYLIVDNAYRQRGTIVLGSENLIQSEQAEKVFLVPLDQLIDSNSRKTITKLQLGVDESITRGSHEFTVIEILLLP